ncbi:MAG: PilZ domain-containing protein [Motiliproteus sp.]
MKSTPRKQVRMPVVWKATLVRLNGEHLSGSTDNVSTAGLNVIIAKELVIGEPVRMDIVTPCRLGTRFFKLDCVVVYQKGLEQNLGYAVGFKLLQPADEYVGFVEMLTQEKGWGRSIASGAA